MARKAQKAQKLAIGQIVYIRCEVIKWGKYQILTPVANGKLMNGEIRTSDAFNRACGAPPGLKAPQGTSFVLPAKYLAFASARPTSGGSGSGQSASGKRAKSSRGARGTRSSSSLKTGTKSSRADGSSDDERCEGCKKPATQRDCMDVPLCDGCMAATIARNVEDTNRLREAETPV